MKTRDTLPLNEATYGQIKLVGGKAASLGEMLKAKLPVPDGFVITTDVYRQHDLRQLEKELFGAFDKLGVGRVAVRSSAVAEDSTDASWAGQLETVLNVKRDGLLKAIKYCWKSIESDRAQSYAKDHQVTKSAQAMAVVVQAMVNSDISGVMFTANPVNNDRDQSIIEAIYGLGEPIVQGQVTPESYVLDNKTGNVVEHSEHRQTRQLIYKDGKNREVKLDKPGAILSNEQLNSLFKLGQQIEKYYGKPQDIEWAIEKGKIHIVQSRPITTLTSVNQSILDEFKQYLGTDKLMRFEGDFMPFQLMIEWWNHYDREHNWQGIYPVLFYFTPERTTGYISHDKYRGIALETFDDLVNGKRSLKEIESGYRASKAAIQAVYDKYFLTQVLATEPEANLLKKYRDLFKEFQVLVAWTLFYEQLDESAVAEVLIDKSYQLDKIWDLVKLPIFPSFESRKKQLELEVLKGLKSLKYIVYALSDYTFLADESDVAETLEGLNVETLQEDIQQTTVINQQAKQKLNEGLEQLPLEEAKIVQILQWVLHNRDERKFVINQIELLLYHLAQELFKHWRIDTKYVRYTGISEILQGKEYVRSIQDDLPKRSDGFCILYRPDRSARISYTSLVTQIDELDKIIVDQVGKNQSFIRGEIGNMGKAKGVVRVIRKRSEFDSFEDGEILVTGMTRPEFAPLMRRSAAIVTDEGGITSHAAIVAREMNKPCIIGTKVATQILKTGDLVEVDANKGIIKILENTDNEFPEFFAHCVKTIARPSALQRDELVRYTSNSVYPVDVVTIPMEGTTRGSYLEAQNSALLLEKCLAKTDTKSKLTNHLDDYANFKAKVSKFKEFVAANPRNYDAVFTEYFELLRLIGPFLYTAIAVDSILYPEFKTKIEARYSSGKAHKILEIVATPTDFHDYQKLQLALYELLPRYQKTPNACRTYIADLVIDFQHINEYTFVEHLTDVDDINAQLKEMSLETAKTEAQKIRNSIETSANYYSDLAKLITDKQLLNSASLIKEYSLLRTDRIDKLKLIQVVLRLTFDELAKDLKQETKKPWSRKHVANLLFREIDTYLQEGIPPDFEAVEERVDQQYLYYYTNHTTTVTTNPALVAEAMAIIIKSEDAKTDSLISTGTTAFKGMVTGKVVRINNKHDLTKVNIGDIMVATVTMPEYTPAMKKAAGFITAEGGITSHAAIISRELQRPCIVGAANCMDVLKDGDYILLDSTNQLVTYSEPDMVKGVVNK